jgi:hypothetical protein
MFNASDDSYLFKKPEKGSNHLPLYESKFFAQYDHPFTTTSAGDIGGVTPLEKRTPAFTIVPQFDVLETEVPNKFRPKIHNFSLPYRIIARSTDERTLIATILPKCGLLN